MLVFSTTHMLFNSCQNIIRLFCYKRFRCYGEFKFFCKVMNICSSICVRFVFDAFYDGFEFCGVFRLNLRNTINYIFCTTNVIPGTINLVNKFTDVFIVFSACFQNSTRQIISESIEQHCSEFLHTFCGERISAIGQFIELSQDLFCLFIENLRQFVAINLSISFVIIAKILCSKGYICGICKSICFGFIQNIF